MNRWMEFILKFSLKIIIIIMSIHNLTEEELDGLDIVINNGAVISASITTADIVEEPIIETPVISDEINMVCFWDSNTFWLNLQESEKFATLLNNNPDITSFNEWISGNTSANLLSRIQASVFNRKDINKRNILVLLIWTNDPWYNLTLQQSKDNIDSIISQSISEGWEVIYLTYPPSDALQFNDNLRAINAHISSEVNWYSTIDINSLFITPYDWNVNRDELINTQLHFNWSWHIIISEAIQNFLWYNNFQVNTDELSTVNTELNWDEWVYYLNIGNTKRILLSKLNNMFKLWIINYTVSSGGGDFGWNTSLSTDLVNVWDFESSATDLVWGNNWTVTGATNIAAKFGNWYNFSATSNRINLGSNLSSTIKSVSVWAKKSATGNWGRVMWNTAGNQYLFQLYGNGSNYCNIWGGTISWSQTDDTNWHHYAITADWATIKIYQDSILKVTTADTSNFSGLNMIWNTSTSYNSATAWSWLIDEWYTWSKVVTQTDVNDLYASWSGLFYNS